MTVPRIFKPAVKFSLLSVLLFVLVAILLGAALTWRVTGHDLSLVPEMTASQVTLSTGAQLYVRNTR